MRVTSPSGNNKSSRRRQEANGCQAHEKAAPRRGRSDCQKSQNPSPSADMRRRRRHRQGNFAANCVRGALATSARFAVKFCRRGYTRGNSRVRRSRARLLPLVKRSGAERSEALHMRPVAAARAAGPRSQRHDTITKFLLQTGPCAKHTNPIWDGCAKRGFLTGFIGKCYTSDEKGPVKNL